MIPGFNPADVSRAVKSHSVADVLLVPTMIQLLLDSPDFEPSNFDSLNTIVYGASPMPLGNHRKGAAGFAKHKSCSGLWHD